MTSKTPREMRQTVIDRAITANHTITDEDVTASETLRLVAIDFIQSYTGKGYFMRSLHEDLFKYGKVSVKQMRGALNAMISEYTATNTAGFYMNLPDTHEFEAIVPNGTYAVPINESGEYRVIKLVACPKHFNKPAGTQLAKYQSGADNEHDYTGFAFVNDMWYILRRKFTHAPLVEHALCKLLSTGKYAEYGRLWAMASGQCFICGHKLTVPSSKQAGIGPVCAANVGIDIQALAFTGGSSAAERQAKAQAEIDELF